MDCTRATSKGFSLMCDCIGSCVFDARSPRLVSKGREQEGANRGVSMGVMSLCSGSKESICEITAFVSLIANSGLSSR